MKLTIMYIICVLTLVLCGEMITGSCDVKLEGSLLKDVVEMLLKKDSDKGCALFNRKKIPAFSAAMTKSKSLSSKEIIKFNKVFTNIQNGYNPSTGIFTAPIAGVYQFSSVVMSDNGKFLVATLWLNDTVVSSVYIKGSAYQTGALSMILDVQKGDQIAVKSYGNYVIYSDSLNYSTFSGSLISQ
ncbi:complement C1q-like protein 3 isoform X2 [Mytilus californianus]|uniref:complement C1q-like protein 3 isoform X2 n=1 Tax=Mytilus californianus TaxID=6549 RepID=UPI002248651F|nr:complement C1q-like protein 3 isoform X2 [Mytilus californianus]